jgi:hypothetical protein
MWTFALSERASSNRGSSRTVAKSSSFGACTFDRSRSQARRLIRRCVAVHTRNPDMRARLTSEEFTRLTGSTASRSRPAVATRASERLEPAPVALARPFAQVGAERFGYPAFEGVLFAGAE